MSGLDILKKIKSTNPSIKAIMLTGRIEKDFKEEAEKLGVVDYIHKPIDLTEFKEKISKYILP